MVDTETIETKVIDKKEKVEDTVEDTKEKIKTKTEEAKEELKTKKDEGKEKGKTIKESISKDINEGVDSVKKMISDYKASTIQTLNTEILEDENTYYIRVAVPGIEKDEIEINAGDQEITIEVTFKPLSDSLEDIDVLHNEMKVGRCSKTITFNNVIDIEKISAKDHRGVVDLTIPKVPKPQVKINVE